MSSGGVERVKKFYDYAFVHFGTREAAEMAFKLETIPFFKFCGNTKLLANFGGKTTASFDKCWHFRSQG